MNGRMDCSQLQWSGWESGGYSIRLSWNMDGWMVTEITHIWLRPIDQGDSLSYRLHPRARWLLQCFFGSGGNYVIFGQNGCSLERRCEREGRWPTPSTMTMVHWLVCLLEESKHSTKANLCHQITVSWTPILLENWRQLWFNSYTYSG